MRAGLPSSDRDRGGPGEGTGPRAVVGRDGPAGRVTGGRGRDPLVGAGLLGLETSLDVQGQMVWRALVPCPLWVRPSTSPHDRALHIWSTNKLLVPRTPQHDRTSVDVAQTGDSPHSGFVGSLANVPYASPCSSLLDLHILTDTSTSAPPRVCDPDLGLSDARLLLERPPELLQFRREQVYKFVPVPPCVITPDQSTLL